MRHHALQIASATRLDPPTLSGIPVVSCTRSSVRKQIEPNIGISTGPNSHITQNQLQSNLRARASCPSFRALHAIQYP
jgi:hypothetical protein